MTGLNPRKLYVDSYYRSSGTHSDFSWTLPQSFECDHDTVMLVDAFATANEFAAIMDLGSANNLLKFSTRVASVVYQWQAIIPSGHYTADELAVAIETAITATGSSAISCTYNAQKHRFVFNSQEHFKIWTQDMLHSMDNETGVGWFQAAAADSLANEVIGNLHGQPLFDTVHTMPEMCDLAPVKVLYLCSNVGQFTAIDPRGQADNIIRRVDVSAPFGSWFADRAVTPAEYVEVGGMQLSQLRFQLRDSHGAVVHKTKPVSFSLVFLSRSMLTV